MCTDVSVTFTCKLHTYCSQLQQGITLLTHSTDLNYCVASANAMKHNHALQNSTDYNGNNSANLCEFPHNTYSP